MALPENYIDHSGPPETAPANAIVNAAKMNQIGAEVNAKLSAAEIHAAAVKTTPVDADEFPLIDSAALFTEKRFTWASMKAAILAYIASASATLTGKTISGTSNTISGLTPSAVSATGTPSSTTYWRGDNTWNTPPGGAGSGDVTGPSSSVDGEVALFSGTTGDVIKAATTSSAVTVGSVNLGHASDTTIARSAAGFITVEGKDVLMSTSMAVANDTTLDIVPVAQNTWVEDTGLTAGVTVTATGGQPGWVLWVALIGTAARAITWDPTDFENGAATLPASTTGTQRLDTFYIWNSATSRWRCMDAYSG